jgi:hypothetical protein
VDLSTLSLGERIAAVSGVALFGLLFASWLEDENAWELFTIVHVLLALLALAAVALPLARAVGSGPRSRASTPAILTRIGIVTLTITATFLLEGEDREVGIFLAVLASGGILYGGLTTPGVEAAQPGRERPRQRGRERPRRPLATEEFEQPPPGMESRRGGERAVGGPEQESVPTTRAAPEPPSPPRERTLEGDEDLFWSEPSSPPGQGGSTEVRPPRRSREPPEPR